MSIFKRKKKVEEKPRKWRAYISNEKMEILLTNARKFNKPAGYIEAPLQVEPTANGVRVLEGQGYRVRILAEM